MRLSNRQRVKDAEVFRPRVKDDGTVEYVKVEMWGAVGYVTEIINRKLVRVEWEFESPLTYEQGKSYPSDLRLYGQCKPIVTVKLRETVKDTNPVQMGDHFIVYSDGREVGEVMYQDHTWNVVFVRLKRSLPDGVNRDVISRAIDASLAEETHQVRIGILPGQGKAQKSSDDAVLEWGMWIEDEDFRNFRGDIWDEVSLGGE